MRHDWRLVQSGLSVNQKDISCWQMAMNNFTTHLELVSNPFEFIGSHVSQWKLVTCLLIFNNVCSRMDWSSIDYALSQPIIIIIRDTFREGQFSCHKDRHSNLVCRDVWIRWNNTSAAKVDTLTHHLHPKHSFLSFQKLSDSWLTTINRFLCHWRIHKRVHCILQLNPDLSWIRKRCWLGCFLEVFDIICTFLLFNQCLT